MRTRARRVCRRLRHSWPIVGFGVSAGGLLLIVVWWLLGPRDIDQVPVFTQVAFAVLAFGAVISYTLAAWKQAVATEHAVEAALADRASLLVVEEDERGIETVGDYAAKGTKIPGLTHDKSKHNWLVIKIQNAGYRQAWNVRAERSPKWRSCRVGEGGWMQRAIGGFDGEEKGYWREWCLPAGASRFLYFPPPEPAPAAPSKEIYISFIWYDPLYYPWTNHVRIFKEGCTWYTNWDDATPDPHWWRHED